MKRTVRLKTYFPYDRKVVWKAITNADLLSKWFMENDFVPELNREFTFHKDPQPGWDGMTYCKVTAIEPFKKIAYTYSGKAGGKKHWHVQAFIRVWLIKQQREFLQSLILF